MIDLDVGDRFRWKGQNTVYRVVELKDYGVQVNWVVDSGPDKGRWGYTFIDQPDLEKVND